MSWISEVGCWKSRGTTSNLSAAAAKHAKAVQDWCLRPKEVHFKRKWKEQFILSVLLHCNQNICQQPNKINQPALTANSMKPIAGRHRKGALLHQSQCSMTSQQRSNIVTLPVKTAHMGTPRLISFMLVPTVGGLHPWHVWQWCPVQTSHCCIFARAP